MFPEGTRSARGGQGTYKSGASRLAVACGLTSAGGWCESKTVESWRRQIQVAGRLPMPDKLPAVFM